MIHSLFLLFRGCSLNLVSILYSIGCPVRWSGSSSYHNQREIVEASVDGGQHLAFLTEYFLCLFHKTLVGVAQFAVGVEYNGQGIDGFAVIQFDGSVCDTVCLNGLEAVAVFDAVAVSNLHNEVPSFLLFVRFLLFDSLNLVTLL